MKKYIIGFLLLSLSCFIYYVNWKGHIPSSETLQLISQQWETNRQLLDRVEALTFDSKFSICACPPRKNK